ncbi:MAG: single-stranded-DNA-specific exonuclease RecJ [Coriobacteriales bacterium]|nr:single-stranded-DNA-specific exonuclease RecJ [Coriobacteriales bacterium]
MPGLFNNRRWNVLPQSEEAERLLCEKLGITPLVARILTARGIDTVAEARDFLAPSLLRDWADPLDIPGMAEAADRVQQALAAGERIAVFGDFDVDGMTSTCLLTLGLREFGGDVHPYIPHRFGEGYGLSGEALDRVISDCRPQLIITVDNGIAAGKEVAWLLEQGIDVVITDHHEPGGLVPQGVPVTDPKLSEDCYSRELSGAGVALKLIYELGRRLGKPDLWWSYTDLAALGTVSDMMILQGENRSLVSYGIQCMRQSRRPGIVALAASAGVDLGEITSDNLPFSLIPRLNAAGRMGTTEVAFDLLISNDFAEATTLAGMLERTNTERRETEAALSEEALKIIDKSYKGERVIVVAGEGWHEGVKGIVASRIVSKYHVPAIVFSVSDGLARGSGRSVGSVDLFRAVDQCSDLLVRFGGHSGAVGVTCEVDKIDAFRHRLEHVMDSVSQEEFVDRGEVAALVSLDELTQEGIAALDALQPFGQGNKRPLLGVRGVFMRNRARVGYDGNHLRFVATDGMSSVSSIMFRAPQMERAYTCEGMVDLVVDAVNETWQGRTHPKLMVRDICYRDDARPDEGLIRELMASEHILSSQDEQGQPAVLSDERARLSSSTKADVLESLRKNFIGDHELLPAQRAALEQLAQGKSTLCVMATGRGKSLIFHMHAARTALCEKRASIFVFPLRALVNDQAFHLRDSFSRLGLEVCVLTGETDEAERKRVHAGLATGSVDVVLTTPEYLAIHANRFAQARRIGFLVIDEAHHAGTARTGQRSAYTKLPSVLKALGNPTALAVTATATEAVGREICRLLSIAPENVLVDATVRENLRIEDCRELRDRSMRLAALVATGEKTVVYVNSRDQAVTLVRSLRADVPELGQRIAFYHAGLSRDLRMRVEKAFRDDRLTCIVSTSAFGEGVNLPGIRNVVLYHLPFGETDFNQMSGRAGRDGKEARVHLLYGGHDARLNERILMSGSPSHDDLATLYRALMTEARRMPSLELSLGDQQILSVAQSIDMRSHLTCASVESGLLVFRELGFLEIEGFEERRRVRMMASPGHVDLHSSLRYAEGQHAINAFAEFCDWALTAAPQELLAHINRPITPGFGRAVDC